MSRETEELLEARKSRYGVESAEEALRTLVCEGHGRNARELYAELVAEVRLVKRARINYANTLEMVEGLPSSFSGLSPRGRST